jgi:hypothetical protein
VESEKGKMYKRKRKRSKKIRIGSKIGKFLQKGKI